MLEKNCPNDEMQENTDIVRYPMIGNLMESLNELLNDSFMQAYTNFQNFNEFKFSSAVFVNWDAPMLIYSKASLDLFVTSSTRFSSWAEMLKEARDIFDNQ